MELEGHDITLGQKIKLSNHLIYSIPSLVRGSWDEKFSARKSCATEGLRSREGHNKSPLTYHLRFSNDIFSFCS
jgi:hypothetical protein